MQLKVLQPSKILIYNSKVVLLYSWKHGYVNNKTLYLDDTGIEKHGI